MARKFANGIDLLGTEVLNASFQKLAADPSGGGLWPGRHWLNTTEHKFKVYDGTGIVVLGDATIDPNTAKWKILPVAGDANVMVAVGGDGLLTLVSGLNGMVTFTNGVPAAAVAGTDYVSPAGAETLTNKTIDAGSNALSGLSATHFAPGAICVDIPNATSGQLANAEAVKFWVEELLAAIGRWAGPFDASGGTLPATSVGGSAIQGGDYWRVTVAGIIVGLGALEIGDVLVANIDAATVAADFFVMQGNITNAVMYDGNTVSPEDDEIAVYSGTTGKLIKGSGFGLGALTSLQTQVGDHETLLANRIVSLERTFLETAWAGPVNGEYSLTLVPTPDIGQFTHPLLRVTHGVDDDDVEVDSVLDTPTAFILKAAAPFPGTATILDVFVPII